MFKYAFLVLAVMVLSCSPNTKATENHEVNKGGALEAEAKVFIANAETSLKIDGMMCEKGCVATISKAMAETQGVSSCEINFEEGSAVIKFDSTLTEPKAIIAVINSLAEGHYTASTL